jgi:hypothetical protein
VSDRTFAIVFGVHVLAFAGAANYVHPHRAALLFAMLSGLCFGLMLFAIVLVAKGVIRAR